jgi:NitT/TauT family transport system permease protein
MNRRNRRIEWKRIARLAASAVAFIVLWQLADMAFHFPPYILPSPISVGKALVVGLFLVSPFSPESFLYQLASTLQATLLGFGIGVVLGLLIAAAMAEFPVVEEMLMPYIVAFQSLPKVAIAPIVIIWFGYGISSKMAVGAMLAIFPMIVNPLQGLTAIEPDKLELLHALRASRWTVFWHIKLPSALPLIFTGMELSIVYALLATIVAEFLGAQSGIGVMITQLQTVSDTAGIFAALCLLSLVGWLLNAAVKLVRRRVLFWDTRHSVSNVAP